MRILLRFAIIQPYNVDLDWKGIAISLFFGLTIGFGTGFVGTGGGMMMLVVFTAFLGIHIVIHPTIILERWNVLLILNYWSIISEKFQS